MNPSAVDFVSDITRFREKRALTNSRAPDGKSFVRGGQHARLGVAVDKVSVGVVLDHEVIRRVPVVEDLGAEDVTADTPCLGVALRLEPLKYVSPVQCQAPIGKSVTPTS